MLNSRENPLTLAIGENVVMAVLVVDVAKSVDITITGSPVA